MNQDKKEFIKLFLKEEAGYFLMCFFVGLAGSFAHNWFVGVKLFLGCFLLMQLVLLYLYKDVLLLMIRRERNDK